MMMRKYIIPMVFTALLSGCGGSGSSSGSSSDSSAGSNGGTGKGGSMARFAISGDYLYTLNKKELTVFDITEPDNPFPYTKDRVPWDVETLFSYGEYLYIGAEGGVYIYSKPTPNKGMSELGRFTHIKSCDPVVVEDGFAYVTLNSGSSCRLQSGANSLQVLDVTNPLKPISAKMSDGNDTIRNMIEPKGLGIDGDILFVCDGKGGLKVFDVNKTENNETNQTTVDLYFNRASSLSKINCYDVIPNNKNLIVSNGDDVRQFDYSKLPMIELGRIK
jgi:hypothetical protein